MVLNRYTKIRLKDSTSMVKVINPVWLTSFNPPIPTEYGLGPNEICLFPLFLKILNTKEARNQHQGGNKNKNAKPFAQLLYYQHFCCTSCCSWTKAFVILQTWGSVDFRGQNITHFATAFCRRLSAAVGVRNHQFRLALYLCLHLCLSRHSRLVVYILAASPDFWSVNNLTSSPPSSFNDPPQLSVWTMWDCPQWVRDHPRIEQQHLRGVGTWRPFNAPKKTIRKGDEPMNQNWETRIWTIYQTVVFHPFLVNKLGN